MLYYFLNVRCPHCRCECRWGVEAESEPPQDTIFTVYCPMHGGPMRVRFQYFKPVESLPPNTPTDSYPPKPPKPPTPYYPSGEARPKWWQFWKW